MLYRELPVETSTFLADSLPSFNRFTSGSNRLLLGSYQDPEFGVVTAEIYSQIRPSTPTKVLEPGAIYDSVTLKLRLDLYRYGSLDVTPQTYKIFQITEELLNDHDYFNRSSVATGRTEIGRTGITVNPDYIDQIREANRKDTILISTTLSPGVGKVLFDMLATRDSTFTNFTYFKKAFPGIALVPDGSDKILGFDPSSALSELVVHYHVDTIKYNYDFYFSEVMGFSRITSNRQNTALYKLATPLVEYAPAGEKNYVQSGVGIYSIVDFDPLLRMKDTISNLAFNAVEIHIPIESYTLKTPPPEGVALRLLNDDNSFAGSRKLFFGQYLVSEQLTDGLYIKNDQSSGSVLFLNEAKTYYTGNITLFAQALITENDAEKRFSRFAFFPTNPESSKSLERFYFDKNKVKLRVYYTKALKQTDIE